jgi:hypothetical protein
VTKLAIAFIAALTLAACGKSENKNGPTAEKTAQGPAAETPPATPAADAGAAAGSADVAPETAGSGEVPTEQDFEDKATKEVDQKNLEGEVKKMETELGAK